MKKTFMVLAFIMIISCTQAMAVTNTTAMNATNDFTYFNAYWNAITEILYNPIGGFIDGTKTSISVAEHISGVPDDWLSLQLNNGNGNYTKQIGMDTVLFESQRVMYMKRISDMWSRYIILLYILKEIVTLAFYGVMIWLTMYFFFVAVPSVFMKITNSMKEFIRQAGAK
jgi:hypothetical protein